MKYRIRGEYFIDKDRYVYHVQKKFLFFWIDIHETATFNLNTAKEYLRNYRMVEKNPEKYPKHMVIDDE